MPPPQRPERIAKLLARAGIASRREVERMIAEGRVAKDGAVLETPATLLPSLDGVTVDGDPVAAPTPARLFLYHKPAGLLVTERDPKGRPTIYDRLPETLPRVVPVGRLDLATEGLLLLTTDGELKRQLELPATGVERAYRARAYGQVTQARLEELIDGVEIEGVRYGAIDANIERRTGANLWIELVLTEGKNREVRRVLEHLGLQVSRLIRTRYGPFGLGDLPPGEVAEARRHDVESFRAHPTRRELPQPPRATRVAEARQPEPKPVRAARTPVAGRSPGPARPPKPKPVREVRVRADGSEARREGSPRAERARAFRQAREPRPVAAPDPRPGPKRGAPKPASPPKPRGPRRPPSSRR